MPRTEEEIRKRAHAIWEKEGRPEGHHERHWEEAAREVKEGSSKAKVAKKPNGEMTASKSTSATKAKATSQQPKAASAKEKAPPAKAAAAAVSKAKKPVSSKSTATGSN